MWFDGYFEVCERITLQSKRIFMYNGIYHKEQRIEDQLRKKNILLSALQKKNHVEHVMKDIAIWHGNRCASK